MAVGAALASTGSRKWFVVAGSVPTNLLIYYYGGYGLMLISCPSFGSSVVVLSLFTHQPLMSIINMCVIQYSLLKDFYLFKHKV